MKSTEKIGKKATLVTDGELKYIEFECLKKYNDKLIHCVSTRYGGVSQGECRSLNLGFNRNDTRDNVVQNYQLLCNSIGVKTDSIVLTNQLHDINVAVIDEKDKGKGFSRRSDLIGIDGLLTTSPGVTMVTFHADCVPVFLFEPGINAAALLHSGWRGTLKNIASSALTAMREIPGFRADRLVASIGPSIDKCCFEVDEDVYKLFENKFDNVQLYTPVGDKKWNIDLKEIIKLELLSEGMQENNIHDCGICTKCRKDLFFSYRGDDRRTGSFAAFMQIKE